MKKKAINLAQAPMAVKRVLFAFLFFSVWAAPNVGANPSLSEEKVNEEQVLQDGKQVTVKGSVVDSKNEPLIGVSVKVVGTSIGTATDFDGNFTINVPRIGSVLEFTYVGYTSQKVTVGNNTTLTIVMEDDSQVLDQVVVTALGIKKDAKKLGYSVSTVDASDLTKTASPSLGSALYGKASGVRIQTAPGGAAGAISINVRGLSSMTGTNQPLIVVDGVPIHNGDANNKDYYSNQRVQSNGLADINPEDIENISILKGAAASSLYGSEALNGVVMITTKTGKGTSGYGVDFNANLTFDPIAYMPQYQTKYGPGPVVMSRTGASGNLIDADGWRIGGWDDRNGVNHRRGASTTQYWGPRYDGGDVTYYDGGVRKYSPINDNPWSEIFRTGITQQYNLSITKGNEQGNMRFAYTFMDNKPTQYNSSFKKHNFNLTGNYNVTDKIKFSYGVNYILQDIKNRPYRISRLTNNFTGMPGTFDDVKYLRESTITSLGYLNNVYTAPSVAKVTPEEGYWYKPAPYDLVSEYFWNVLAKEQTENNNRILANVAPSWEIINGLTLKGRIATDFTSIRTENKEPATQPIIQNANEGSYNIGTNRYQIVYGDIMLNYTRDLTSKLNMNALAGWQGRSETGYNTYESTTGGLSIENWYSLNASNKAVNTDVYKATGLWPKTQFLKTAFYQSLGFSYDNWAYLEGTLREEKVSTLYPGDNSFVYPSINGSIIYTELMKQKLPTWYDFGKIRASYGVVGHEAAIYDAQQSYTQQTVGGGWIYAITPSSQGNNRIRPEMKYEWEFGLESKFFNNRLGFEMSYYSNRVKDQILRVTTAATSGAGDVLMNVGELKNKGLEISLYGTPISTKDWRLDLRGNIAWNKNKVSKLLDGLPYIEHYNLDNGSAYLRSYVGQPMGDIYAYAPVKDDDGNYVVMKDGYYLLSEQKVGNAMPKVVGGFATTLSYKNFVFDMSFDYRIGGAVINTPYQYMMGQGGIKESLKYHDGEGYGATYYVDASRNIVPYSGATGPNGERIYDNGIILPGVTEDGNPNTKMISADQWAYWTYNWGGNTPDGDTYYAHSVFDNTYVKCRELSLGYSLPATVLSKIKCKNMTVSVYGRNLFYIYKRLPLFDAEATDGTNWQNQTQIGGSTATTRSIGLALRASF